MIFYTNADRAHQVVWFFHIYVYVYISVHHQSSFLFVSNRVIEKLRERKLE